MHAATLVAHNEFTKLNSPAWRGRARAMWKIAYRRARCAVRSMFPAKKPVVMLPPVKPNVIQIGHGSYRGANELKICRSKAAAVRELRERGVKRDVARAVVNDVCKRFHGYATLRASEYCDVIEVECRNDLSAGA